MPASVSASRAPRAAYVAWAIVCVVWGTTYLGIKVALETVPPFLMGGIRYLLAGAAIAVWMAARGEKLPGRRTWPAFAVLGFLMLLLGNGGVVWAEKWVPSGFAAVIIATTPFWMVGVEALMAGGEPLSARRLQGLALGFAGILVLVGPDLVAGGAARWQMVAGVCSLQVASAGWAIGSAWGKRHVAHVAPLAGAAMQMLFGGAWMLTAATLVGDWRTVTVTPVGVAAVLYLTLVGGVAGFGAYTYALAHLPVSFVSLYAYVNPVIAVTLGTVFLGEPFNGRTVVAIALVLAGMAIVSSGPRRR